MIDFVEYDEGIHKEALWDMFLKYGEWLDEQVLKHHGFHLFTDRDVKSRIDSIVP